MVYGIGYSIIAVTFCIGFWIAAVYMLRLTIKFLKAERRGLYITELEKRNSYGRNVYRVKGYFTDDPERKIYTAVSPEIDGTNSENSPGMVIAARKISNTQMIPDDNPPIVFTMIFFAAGVLCVIWLIAIITSNRSN